MKKIAAGLLILALLATPTLASGQAQSGSVVITGPLRMIDTAGHWAEMPIRLMMAKMTAFGFLDMTYRPDAPMTRLDTAIMVVRVAGLEPLARRLAGRATGFIDLGLLTSLERGYVAAAEATGLMIGDGASLRFRPHDTITRNEVAVVVIRALGLDAVARSRTDLTLPFRDGAQVPGWAERHIALGVQRRLLLGYPEPDGSVTWRGEKAVTRAEATAILSRIDEQIESLSDALEVSGRVEDLTETALTLEGGRTIPLEANAQVGAEVRKGAAVIAILNETGRAVLVETGSRQPVLERRSGSLTLVGQDRIRLALEGGGTREIRVNAATAVYLDGRMAALSDLSSLQYAAVTAQGGVALEVRATGR
jgi:hypothetical protein